MRLAKGVIRDYDEETALATVEIVGGHAWYAQVPAATHLAAANLVDGRRCAVLFFDEQNPLDAVVFATYDTTAEAPAPAAHASTHEAGGADELDVTGLSGELADLQPVKAHDHSGDTGDGENLDGSAFGPQYAGLFLASHVAEGDPPYQAPTFRAIDPVDLGSGTPDGTKFLRDDGVWVALSPLLVQESAGTATATTTSSGSYADLDSMSVTVDVPVAGLVKLHGFVNLHNNYSGSNGVYLKLLEGTTQLGPTLSWATSSTYDGVVPIDWTVEASAGEHTYKVQWAGIVAGRETQANGRYLFAEAYAIPG